MSDLVSSVLGTILALVVRSVWSKWSGLLAMLSRRLPRAAPVDCNYKKKGDEASSREVRYYVSGVDGDVLTEEGRSVGPSVVMAAIFLRTPRPLARAAIAVIYIIEKLD